ncbi:MogA/MoaB family molybdenum cofactor biosynthesis protein [Brachyspira aalborgi]|uniref:Molybdopterin adenylyltransferase n=1 Tax=Brachyspira aalborgi TaxID=29522 RepID=A0A5C8CM00_9SPIR|nr:MogA/MoaB family molybdenum cofactor biosynthesis protein [Brachyspira aalborgi]TXJ13311.1 MogA/MoaB family molybdenum cofactor biosynthesis protein [Brachyspira aalborgi]
MRILVITVSDRAFKGIYEDKSGEAITILLKKYFIEKGFDTNNIKKIVVADEYDIILNALKENKDNFDIIITTGGTGLSERDVTPEATRDFCKKEVSGISEYLRAESIKETIFASLSRGYAGINDKVFVVNFPGSEKGAIFCTNLIIPLLAHIVDMMNGKGH